MRKFADPKKAKKGEERFSNDLKKLYKIRPKGLRGGLWAGCKYLTISAPYVIIL